MDAYTLKNDQVEEVSSMILYQSSCNPDQTEAPFNTRFVPCRETVVPAKNMQPAFADSMGSAVAAPEYAGGFIKKTFLGPLYRTTWATAVEVPYLNLDSEKGGLTAKGKGGGKQTRSPGHPLSRPAVPARTPDVAGRGAADPGKRLHDDSGQR